MEIKNVDLTSPTSLKDFVTSIKETGFAVVSNHGIDKKLISKVQEEWLAFFRDTEVNKMKYLNDPETGDGYFPFGSENAKGHKQADLKEFFHHREGNELPSGVSEATDELVKELSILGFALLRFLHFRCELPEGKNIMFDAVCRDSQRNLFRPIYYPPTPKDKKRGATRAAAHEDINFITLIPAATDSGLEVKGTDGKWHKVKHGKNDIVVNIGDMLEMFTEGHYEATTHRVVNPKKKDTERLSMPFFMHPLRDLELKDGFTAQDYFLQRMKEIGLESKK